MVRSSATILALLLLATPVLAQTDSEPSEGAGEAPMAEEDAEAEATTAEEPASSSATESGGADVGMTASSDEAAGDEAAPAAADPRLVGRMPSLFGHTGLFHLFTADSTPSGTFTVGLFGEFFSAGDVIRDGDDNTRFLGRLTLSYTPHPNVETFATFEALGNTSNFTDPELIQSQGDLTLGAKGFGHFGNGFGAGGSLTLRFLNGSNSVGFDFAATSADFRGFLSYDLLEARGLPLQLHFNLAYYLDNSPELFDFELQRVERFAHQVSDFDEFEIGLGVEVPVPWVTPFLEWRLGIPIGSGDEQDCSTNPIPCPSDAGFASFPHVLTIGIKGSPVRSLSLNLGIDISLASEEATGLPGDPPYNVIFGIAYLIDPTPPEVVSDAPAAPISGWILGEVVDSESGEPIPGALVSYPDTDFSSQATNDQTGRFRSYEFAPETEVVVQVNHPNYQERTFRRVIVEGEDAIRVRLERRQDLAVLTGRVLNRAGEPLPATIFLAGPEDSQLEADPLTSEFEARLPIGRYVVTVVAADHISSRQTLELAPGEEALEVTLDPRPPAQVAVVKGDRIELEGERVTFIDNTAELEMASEALLDQVADLLRQYPDLELRVVAHSDDAGTAEETQQQAQRVVEYLTDVGIDAARLTAEGAGGERPRFPNITDRNRERNWRVEFLFR